MHTLKHPTSPRQNPKLYGFVGNAAGVLAGFGASQIASDADTEIATFVRVVGASAVTNLVGAQAGITPLTLGMMLVSGVHGYKRSGGSLPYAALWSLAGSVGVGLALGQGFGEPPRHMRGVQK